MVCPSDKRFMLLFTFVKKNKDKKCMVFFSTCSAVKYHAELFNYIDIPVKDIHVGVQFLTTRNQNLCVSSFSSTVKTLDDNCVRIQCSSEV